MSDINEMNVGPRWYVAHTYSGYENKVKTSIEKVVENRNLQHLIYDVRVPVETVIDISFDLIFVSRISVRHIPSRAYVHFIDIAHFNTPQLKRL